VLELDAQPYPELLDVEPRAAPVDTDPFADRSGLLGGDVPE
jgi:hypothetical protein